MSILERLEAWKNSGAISEVQYEAIAPIVRKERFSVFFELNALLYLGILSLIGGIGWVVKDYVATLGDSAILGGLTLMLAACFIYCFSRGLPFSTDRVESATFVFDYVLYLGCLTFAVEIGYIESEFHWLQGQWDYYLLLSAALFWLLAYRFDNRFVLSLALSTLAAWFGVRLSRFSFYYNDVRVPALIYGTVVVLVATWLYRWNLKKHFTETYCHIAALAMFTALLSGVVEHISPMYLLALIGIACIAIYGGIHFAKFAFVAYAILFGYVGISVELVRVLSLDSTATLAYVAVSGSLVIFVISSLARRIGREA
jgi:hypothetical protein